MYTTYILQSEEGKYYIGATENIDKRLTEHNNPIYSSWTHRYRNWKLVYSEEFETWKLARKREIQIKSYKYGYHWKKLQEQFRPYIAE